MNSSDPSESIRASEIVPLIANRFEVRHFRYVGGTLLLLIFSEIAGNFQEDAETMPLVKALIALDNFLIDNKVLPSYHVYMVCEKTENPMPMRAHNILPPSASVFPTDNFAGIHYQVATYRTHYCRTQSLPVRFARRRANDHLMACSWNE